MTEEQKDILWEQRLSNFQKALLKLTKAPEVVDENLSGRPLANYRQKIYRGKRGLVG